MNIGYIDSLKAVGYDVIDWKSFGNFQGTWYALVRDIKTGELGFIQDAYGSCGMCDQWESEYDQTKTHKENLENMGMMYKDAIMSYEVTLRNAEVYLDDWGSAEISARDWVVSKEAIFKAEKMKKDFDKELHD